MYKVMMHVGLIIMLTACNHMQSTIGGIGGGTTIIRMDKIGHENMQFRMLDAVNAIRHSRGMHAVELDVALSEVARAHAYDMAVQNRPWHFSFDGRSPFDRVNNSSFAGEFRGENISETYEDDFHTLNAWINDSFSSGVILDPETTHMGMGYYQEENGKLWWVQIFGRIETVDII